MRLYNVSNRERSSSAETLPIRTDSHCVAIRIVVVVSVAKRRRRLNSDIALQFLQGRLTGTGALGD